jgi:hypothetical protein
MLATGTCGPRNASANASVEMITKDATHNRMEEVSHEQLQNKILNDIREKGRKVEHGDVVHSLAKSIPSKKSFDSTIQMLQEGGIINVRKGNPAARRDPWCVLFGGLDIC